ncbi:MAG TPA: ABC-F family ATP-binding cassette domain-containing protein [Thermotogota bacterium]|nr:ABC-F family ATP-binding cassette domain-containing protein [Thermotogota bacterium]HPR95027.1 ABC-F family ATP-binding cassette domain-containing protein [Thermotogota bacterium]
MLLRTDSLSFGFADTMLISECNIQVEERDKIALIGQNGSGKTTLLKILTGEIAPTLGSVITKKGIKVGYQKQFRVEEPDISLWKEMEKIFQDVINHIENEVEIEHEHLSFEKKIRSILKGVGFSEDDWERPLKTFSGGELTRVSLAKLFMRDYDLLILDEPTNHLDIASVYWLEDFLKSYKGTLLMVTHDREMLNGVINQVFEINGGKIWNFRMKYEDYLMQRTRMIESKEREIKKLEIEVEKQKKLVRQFETWVKMGSKKAISQMHSHEKMLERVEEKLNNVETLNDEQTHIGDIPKPDRANYIVLKCENLSRSIKGKQIFKNASFEVHRGEKVVLLGKNGVGKSTMLKTFAGEQKPNGGFFEFGDKVHFAYLSQDLSNLNEKNTIFEELNTIMFMQYDGEIRGYAGRFGFSGDDVNKRISVLSGGEKLKLTLAKLLLKRPNLLILDEPTNHLDLLSIERLQEVLMEYEGAILMVTHDRRLLNYVSDKIIVLTPDHVRTVDSVAEYVADIKSESAFNTKGNKNERKKLNYEQQKALKNKIKKIENEIIATEERYHELEEEKKTVERSMNSPLYANDYQKLNDLGNRQIEIENELLQILENMESLESEREELLQGEEND